MTKLPWPELNFWSTGEWQAADERLQELSKAKTLWNPGRARLFRALDLVPFNSVRTIILGQDPYPNPDHACGISFSTDSPSSIPPSLATMLTELQSDYPDTKLSGDLTPWCKQGVLLWNAYPTCTAYKSMSHHWPEWEVLTQEILEKQSKRGIVCAFLGSAAGKLAKYVDEDESYVIKVAHPSPLATRFAKSPFIGCRLFSTINAHLRDLGEKPIDWRLG